MRIQRLYAGGSPEHTSYIKLRYIIENLTQNPGAEMIRYGRRKKDILSLAQGEGDAATPEYIIEGANRAMRAGKTFYGPVLGHEELRQELSDYYSRIYNLSVPSNRIYVTGSGTTAMHLSLSALLEKDDEVAAVTPIWKNLLGAVELVEAKINEVPLEEQPDGHWQLDLEKLYAVCTEKTRAILVTTPSNPTGWTMNHDEMKELLAFCRARGIWILSDEVYSRITYDSVRAPSFLDIADPEDKLFVINSFSKAWAMTGWRLGWLVGPANREEAVRDVALYDNMGPCHFSQFGAIEALRLGEPFIKEQTALWRSNLDLVHQCFEETGRIRAARPPATFYSFFRVEGEENCLEYARRLIDEYSLSLAPGCSFGKVGKGFMRMSCAVSRPRLEDALDRLTASLTK